MEVETKIKALCKLDVQADQAPGTRLPRIIANAIIGFGLLASASSAEPVREPKVATAKREVLVQSDHSWDGTKYARYPTGRPELTTLKITIAPHSALPWHTHPFPNAGYILSGELTIHDKESGKSVTYHAGQAFAESVNRVHRGESGDKPVELLVTYAGTPGEPTSIPVKGEQAEY